MATLRQYILSQSTLLPGNTVRDHIKNPISGDTTRLILTNGLGVNVGVPEYTVELGQKYAVEVVQEYTVNVGVPGYAVEVGPEYTVGVNDNHSVGV